MTENAHDLDHVEADTEAAKFRNGMLMSLVICVALVGFVMVLHKIFGG